MLAPIERGEDAEEVHIEDISEEDVQPMKAAHSPETPTAKMIEEHRYVHIPYRDWCRWCVMGRGRGIQHRHGDSSSIPVVGLDYFYITAGGVKIRKELDYTDDAAGNAALEEDRKNGNIVKCLIIRCTKSKNLFPHCVPYKGAGEDRFVAELVVRAVEWLGHTKLIVKADNEPALKPWSRRVWRNDSIASTSTASPPRTRRSTTRSRMVAPRLGYSLCAASFAH